MNFKYASVKGCDYYIDFKPLGAERFIIIYDIAVVLAFPFFTLDASVVFINNIFKPENYVLVDVFKFNSIISVAIVTH